MVARSGHKASGIGAAGIERWAFSDTLAVRYSDIDAQGHLYFANYLVYADEVAGHYLESLGLPVMNPERAPCYLFTVNIQCDFIGECSAGQRVTVSVAFSRLGKTSAELAFRLVNEQSGGVLARGHITQVFVDKTSRRSCPIPEQYLAAIVAAQPELA